MSWLTATILYNGKQSSSLLRLWIGITMALNIGFASYNFIDSTSSSDHFNRIMSLFSSISACTDPSIFCLSSLLKGDCPSYNFSEEVCNIFINWQIGSRYFKQLKCVNSIVIVDESNRLAKTKIIKILPIVCHKIANIFKWYIYER